MCLIREGSCNILLFINIFHLVEEQAPFSPSIKLDFYVVEGKWGLGRVFFLRPLDLQPLYKKDEKTPYNIKEEYPFLWETYSARRDQQ